MKRYVRSDNDNAAIEVMQHNMQYQEDPMVGIFWYDANNKELFGIKSTYADDARWYNSTQFGTEIRTERMLHKTKWQREFHRKKDTRFFGDYTQVPRGRIFEFKDVGFRVYTGDWIDDYLEVKSLIIDEFQLPSNVEFVKDPHWDIGHRWSDEF